MTRLIASEFRKLFTTTWFKITVVVTVVLGPVSAVTNVYTAAAKDRASLASTQSIHHILSLAALTSMVMLAVGIGAMAGEYRHGTVVPTFLVTPRRERVVLAKLATVVLIGAVLSAVAFGLALAGAIPALSAHGIHHLAGDTAQMWLGAIVTGALFGALGVAIGAVTRSTVVAIIGTLVWVQLVEQAFLASVVPSIGRWLPTGANLAITHTSENPHDLLTPVLAVAVLLAWTAVLATGALRFVVERDV
jgi:ABC-type transport system involved in multi-copper enzyme maturation permease subunit